MSRVLVQVALTVLRQDMSYILRLEVHGKGRYEWQETYAVRKIHRWYESEVLVTF